MSGEDWYMLALCGEWIFDSLLTGSKLEYCVTLCALFRLMSAAVITPDLIATLSRLDKRFQALHAKIVPPISRPLVFHRIRHLIEDMKHFGPIILWWCFRNERIIGKQIAGLRRRSGVESHVEANIMRGKLGRFMTGTITVAQQDLEFLQGLRPDPLKSLQDPENIRTTLLSRLASEILATRERAGTRLNLVKYPHGSALRVVDVRPPQPFEEQAIR